MDIDDIRKRVEELVVSSSSDTVRLEDLQAAKGSLIDIGYTSLSYMALLSALEQELGVSVDPYEEPTFLETTGSIADYVADQLGICAQSAQEGPSP